MGLGWIRPRVRDADIQSGHEGLDSRTRRYTDESRESGSAPVPLAGLAGFLVIANKIHSGTEPGRLGSRELISVL